MKNNFFNAKPQRRRGAKILFFLASLRLCVVALSSPAQTPVLFSLQTLTGTINNRSILVTPDTVNNPMFFGTNLVSLLPFELQPVNGQVITNLEPWGYTIMVDGWPRPAHIVVPASTNLIDVVSLFNTNQFSPLNIFPTVGGGGATNLTPWTGPINGAGFPLTNAVIPAGQLTGTIPAATLPGSVVTNNASGVSLNGTFMATNIVTEGIGPDGTGSVTVNAGGGTISGATGSFGVVDGNGSGLSGIPGSSLTFAAATNGGPVAYSQLPYAPGITNANGGNLTNLNPANMAGVVTNTATSVLLNGQTTPALPNPYALFSAESFNGLTSGASITIWPDLSGNNHGFTNMTGVTLMQQGIGGHAALYSTGSGVVSNLNFFNSTCDTNSTLTIVWRSPSGPAGNGTMMASGTNGTSDNFELDPSINVNGNAEYLVQERLINEDDQLWPSTLYQTHVTTLSRNGTNWFWLENEQYCTPPTGLSPEPLQSYNNALANWGFVSGGLWLWNKVDHSYPWNGGLIAALRVDSPALTLPQAQIVARQYDDYYQERNGSIHLFGESQIFGEDPSGNDTNPADADLHPAEEIGRAFNNYYTVETSASGAVSSGTLTNLQQQQYGVSRFGKKIVVWHESCGNGQDTNFAYVTTNLLLFCQYAHSNNEQVVVCTPIDSRIDTYSNAYLSGGQAYQTFTNFSYWLHTNALTFADAVADSWNDPILNQSNAWRNFTYRENDGIGHLNTNGIAYWVNNFIAPAINQLSVPSGISFTGNGCGLTNLPVSGLANNWANMYNYATAMPAVLQASSAITNFSSSNVVGSMTVTFTNGSIINGIAGYYYCIVGIGNCTSAASIPIVWKTNGVSTGFTNIIGYQSAGALDQGVNTTIFPPLLLPANTTNQWAGGSVGITFSNAAAGLYQK